MLKLLIPFQTQITATLIVFFTPIYAAMIAVLILIMIDTITGIIAARRSKETITSKKFGGVVTKFVIYQTLIIAANLCELYLFPLLPFLKISLAFLAITEFGSIGENFQKATGYSILRYVKKYMDNRFRGLLIDDPNIEAPVLNSYDNTVYPKHPTDSPENPEHQDIKLIP